MSKPVVAGTRPVKLTLDAGRYYYCACGRSGKQPFCDGSHKGTGFAPLPFELEAREEVKLCTCKQTQDPPWCDGSHRELEED